MIREIERKSGLRYQVNIRGSDGNWISKTFDNKRAAKAFELQIKSRCMQGETVTNSRNTITLDEYFFIWMSKIQIHPTHGHQREQLQRYECYVSPRCGSKRLQSITPESVAEVLGEMVKLGKSEQTRLHVFNLLRKMFGDAIELFRLLTFNPALRRLKPRVPVKIAAHLSVPHLKKLLIYVEDKEYCIPIWLQSFLGLRVGEVQALTWDDVDFERELVFVRRAYCRKDSWILGKRVIRDFPKNGNQRVRHLPPELLHLLKVSKLRASGKFVAATSFNEMLSYEHYRKTLNQYCSELGIPEIATQGLRHSTAGIYLEEGATDKDIAVLLDNPTAVERYIHSEPRGVDRFAKSIRLLE